MWPRMQSHPPSLFGFPTLALFADETATLQALKVALDQNQASVITTCRGNIWRARSSSSKNPGRRRLLSEIKLPTASPVPGDAGAEQAENISGDTLSWEVLACVGFLLPKSFHVSSSLGGLGNLQLSRYVPLLSHGAGGVLSVQRFCTPDRNRQSGMKASLFSHR